MPGPSSGTRMMKLSATWNRKDSFSQSVDPLSARDAVQKVQDPLHIIRGVILDLNPAPIPGFCLYRGFCSENILQVLFDLFVNSTEILLFCMYFKKDNKLRWQYTTPYDYIFILNGSKVRIKSAKSTKNIDVQKNKMFRQITDIILNSITGGGLKKTSDFQVELYKTDKAYFAKLYPKKKELKQIYQTIEIHFNPTLSMVESVVMMEKTGDSTVVRLTGVKQNVSINEKVFSTD